MVLSINLLHKEQGVTSFIVPPTWLTNKNSKTLRSFMSTHGLFRVNHFGNKVFAAIVDSCIYFTSKNNDCTIKCLTSTIQDGEICSEISNTIDAKQIVEKGNYISMHANNNLLAKIKVQNSFAYLGDISNIVFGIQDRKSSSDPSYIFEHKINDRCKKVLSGKNINQYTLQYGGVYIEYGPWLWNPRKQEVFEAKEKILLRQVGKYPICAYDNEQYYTLNTIYNIIITDNRVSTKYILALLNSKIMRLIWKEIYPEDKDIFPRIKKEQLVEIPIPIVNRERQNEIIEIVDLIISQKEKTPDYDTTSLENTIDNLVCKLYNINIKDVLVD